MRRDLRGLVRRIAGFTLAEVLIVVAIIAILTAIAIPSVIVIRKNLKMVELDDTAREIFLAAQNSLTAHKSAGTLGQIGALSESDPRFLQNGDGGMAFLLPVGAVEPAVAEQYYIIRVNLQYATVLDVFYAEKAFDKSPQDMYDAYGSAADNAASERRKAEIGYYSGDGTTTNPVQQLRPVQLEIQNDNELKAIVTVPDAAEITTRGVTLTFSVEQVGKEGQSYEFPLGSGNLSFDPTTGVAVLLLDSLAPGKQFKDICPGITPGAQIRVTATLSKEGCLPSKVSTETNSLFANRTGDTAQIGWARHLQNLYAAYSKVSGIQAADQTDNITWPEGYAFQSILNSELKSYNGKELEIRALVGTNGLFESIGQAELANIRIVNPKIENNQSSNTAPSVGALAGKAQDSTITGCMVYAAAPVISGKPEPEEGGGADSASSKDNTLLQSYGIRSAGTVGGLIGTMDKCQIAYCAAGLPYITGLDQASGVLGGLIGSSVDGSITGSYAAIDQIGGTAWYVGGLIGYADPAELTVQNSYAVGNISAEVGNGTISGFMNFDRTKSPAVSSSYCAMTYFDKDGKARGGTFSIAYGFMPANRGELGNGSNSLCFYLQPDVTIDHPDSAENPVAVPLSYRVLSKWNGKAADASAEIGAWTRLEQIQSHPYRQDIDGQAYPFVGIKLKSGLPMHHYGSWPATTDKLYLAYYESLKIADNNQQLFFYIVDAGAQGPTVQLPAMSNVVTRDGYALLSEEKYDSITVTYQTSKAATATEVCTLSTMSSAGTLQLGDPAKTYYTYELPYKVIQSAYASETFYQKLEANGQAFWYNPHFAKTNVNNVEDVDPITGPGKAPDKISVRSARQLVALGEHSTYWQKAKSYTFVQEKDIDYQAYTGYGVALSQKTIGYQSAKNTDRAFFGTYEGSYSNSKTHRIRNLSIPSFGYYTGLFGVNSGTIQNIEIEAAGFATPGRNATFAGTLVGMNKGTVNGCAALFPGTGSVSLPYTASCSWGGFVGVNMGTIKNCFAAAPSQAWIKGAGKVAGFAADNGGTIASCYADLALDGGKSASGFITGTFGTVENCYALIKAAAQNGTAAGFSVDGAQKNDAGKVGAIKNCYAAVDVVGKTSYGFAPATDNGRYTGCYYLKGSYSGKAAAGTEKTYDELGNLTWTGSGAWKKATAATSHPFAQSLQGQTFPFPRLAALDHYGDWPEPTDASGGWATGLVYYEKYSDGTYGFYGTDNNGVEVNSLDTSNRKVISGSGYGYLVGKDDKGKEDWNNSSISYATDKDEKTISNPYVDKKGSEITEDQTLYAFSSETMELLRPYHNNGRLGKSAKVYRNGDNKNINYVNTFFAAAVDHSGLEAHGTSQNPWQIRTQEQLKNLGVVTSGVTQNFTYDAVIHITHDVIMDESWSPITLPQYTGTATIDGRGNQIKGLKQPLFAKVTGRCTVQNLYIVNADISGSGNIGVFANVNHGKIVNCGATGKIQSTQNSAAGFVYSNTNGTISCCYSNCTVSGKSAAGFAAELNGRYNVSDCYALLAIDESTQKVDKAAGFTLATGWPDPYITNCYAVIVDGAVAGACYGFAPAGLYNLSACYYMYMQKDSLESGSGISCGYSDLKGLASQLGSAWTTPTAGRSHPDSGGLKGKAYPFPMLKALDHYGDWPTE